MGKSLSKNWLARLAPEATMTGLFARLVGVIMILAAQAAGERAAQGGEPRLPQARVDTSYQAPVGGATHRVRAGGDLQAALDAARPGDMVELEAGATFTGSYVLRPKAGEGWVYITSGSLPQLPPSGTRVSPTDAAHMPKIVAADHRAPALIVEPGVRHHRFVGVEITTAYTAREKPQYGIVRVAWRSDGTYSQPPADGIIFDRCYIHGTATGNIRDGIVIYNVKSCAIIESQISDFHGAGWESHAIHVYAVPGPVKIANNDIQGASINVFIGDNGLGGGPIPQDVEIVGNHIHKPWSWKPGHPQYAGIPWLVKNLLEIKAAQRVLIDGNILENVWAGGQSGAVMVITPRAAEIADVTIRRNVLRNFDSGMAISSADVRIDRLLVENNLFYNATKPATMFYLAGTPGKLTQVSIRHNTAVVEPGHSSATQGNFIFFNGSREKEAQGLVVRDNIAPGHYGISGNGKAVGLPSVGWYCSEYDVRNNAFIGGTARFYADVENFGPHIFPADTGAVGFSDTAFDSLEDFVLGPASRYRSAASDGKPLGADVQAILAATKQALSP